MDSTSVLLQSGIGPSPWGVFGASFGITVLVGFGGMCMCSGDKKDDDDHWGKGMMKGGKGKGKMGGGDFGAAKGKGGKGFGFGGKVGGPQDMGGKDKGKVGKD